MTEQAIVIDLTHEPLAIYQGFEQGQALREQYKLDESDATRTPIVLKIADSTRVVTASFALGLLGKSIARSGSIAVFEQRFVLDASQPMMHSSFARYYLKAFCLPLFVENTRPQEPRSPKKHWLVRAAEWLTDDNKRQRVRHASF